MTKKTEKIQGYIFDFNGTMFFDGAKHDFAWRQYLEEKTGREISREEFMEYAYGRTNAAILAHFLGQDFTEEERLFAAAAKEALYRRLCLKDREGLHLTRGLPAYLDCLKRAGMPVAIATAANRDNMEFYFQVFQLEKWFSWADIVLDDGTVKGKPEPDIYIKAAGLLHLPPKLCHVYEDSVSGVLAAKRAGAGKITAVYGDSDYEMLRAQGLADCYIEDFEKERDNPCEEA